ncbi:HNH endonuclease [Streptomyces sp. NPDC000609]|uniref:HNH endonuclease n=1 Tax=Streptomyces sp. NPDC000609 TaxID=3160957 RepID=UPI003398DE9C
MARRIAAAGIDVSHFPGMSRPQLGLLFTLEELRAAAASAESVREVARELGVHDEGQSRAAVAGMLRRNGIDTSHFRNARLAIPKDALLAAVPKATSYADVMRALGLEVNDTNHRRVRRKVLQLKLDTGHFKRRSWASGSTTGPGISATYAPTAMLSAPHGAETGRPSRNSPHSGLIVQREAPATPSRPCRMAKCASAGIGETGWF